MPAHDPSRPLATNHLADRRGANRYSTTISEATMAEAAGAAEDNAVPKDGMIVGDDVVVCPAGLIWVQKADFSVLVNSELLEGASAANKGGC